MFNRIFLFSLSLIFTGQLMAQQAAHRCGFDHWIQQLGANHPENAQALHHDLDRWIEKSRQQGRDNEVYQVPVVFHIVYNTEAQNLADSVVHSQLEVLNEDFRRNNANASETREIFQPVAADVGIEFVLADVDPNDNPTTGIIRKYTPRTAFELNIFSPDLGLDDVKSEATDGSDPWDTERYLNIWVCNISGGFLGQIFGMAYPPANTPNWPDDMAAPDANKEGVLIHYTTLGRNNPQHADDGVDENNLGRTLVHEVGHYFGLRHIWGDAITFIGEDGCAVDDGFTDTPNCAESAGFVCNFSNNSCVDSPVDFPDMIENYMDYSQDACMNLFTQQQADMMRYVLTELRPGLLWNSPSSVESKSVAESIAVFPNPTVADVKIIAEAMIDRVQLLDYTGRMLKEIQAVNAMKTQISLDEVASGSYLLRIFAAGDVAVHQVVKK